MRSAATLLAFLIWLICIGLPAQAHWPITLEDNLPIAADQSTYEGFPTALAYSQGRTLVVFNCEGMGNVYQIITIYGDPVFTAPQPLAPNLTDPYTYHAQVIPDDNDGAFAVWSIQSGTPNQGIYAQRLDDQGNRLWGDSGVRVHSWASTQISTSVDGVGGLLIAVGLGDVNVSRLSELGQPLWGSEGVWACLNFYQQSYPKITHDGNGGANVVWIDYRPPYQAPEGALFMQRHDSNGIAQWAADGIIAYPYSPWNHDVIPDENGGFILHCGSGSDNFCYRIAPDGGTLWLRDHVSWNTTARILTGEPGYFYLGFAYGSGLYAQRMDLLGNFYFPNWSGGQIGALLLNAPGWFPDWIHFAYQAPYFYGLAEYYQTAGGHLALSAQIIDSIGNCRFNVSGAMLACSEGVQSGGAMIYLNVIADNRDGVIAVWERSNMTNLHDVFAKRCNADGTLGGPIWPPSVYHRPDGHILSIEDSQVRLQLRQGGRVKLELFDLLGRKVSTIERAYQPAGTSTIFLGDQNLRSGVYLLELTAGNLHETAKLVIVR